MLVQFISRTKPDAHGTVSLAYKQTKMLETDYLVFALIFILVAGLAVSITIAQVVMPRRKRQRFLVQRDRTAEDAWAELTQSGLGSPQAWNNYETICRMLFCRPGSLTLQDKLAELLFVSSFQKNVIGLAKCDGDLLYDTLEEANIILTAEDRLLLTDEHLTIGDILQFSERRGLRL